MADNSISLIGSIRDNLLALQRTAALRQGVERNLATGRRINQASDDAVAYFQARSLSNRAADLTEIKDTVNQAISTVAASADGARAIGGMLGQLKGLAVAAQATTNATQRAEYAAQFNDLRGQVDSLARDAGYQGVNLLDGTSSALRVEFGTGSLEVAPEDASAAGLGVAAADPAAFDPAVALRQVESATASLRGIEQRLGSNLATLSDRADYTDAVADTLKAGEDKLTLSDATEDAARIVAARTRQQLGQTALAIANESGRSLLALF